MPKGGTGFFSKKMERKIYVLRKVTLNPRSGNGRKGLQNKPAEVLHPVQKLSVTKSFVLVGNLLTVY